MKIIDKREAQKRLKILKKKKNKGDRRYGERVVSIVSIVSDKTIFCVNQRNQSSL